MSKLIIAFLKLLRTHHYVKNIFIFTPLIFGLKIFDTTLSFNTFITFFAFSIVSSSIYVINDICDREFDSIHPQKKSRPIASGIISVKQGIGFSAILFIIGISIAYSLNPNVFYVIFTYAILNLFYSLKFKHIALLDIFIIALGFILRLFAGSIATGIELSHWLIIMTFLLSIFLALGKRRDDILFRAKGVFVRKSIKGYNIVFINNAMTMVSGILILAYILYCIAPDTISHFNTKHLYLTVFFVILGLFRYLQLIFVHNHTSNPVDILYTDRFLQIIIVCWFIMFSGLIYFRFKI